MPTVQSSNIAGIGDYDAATKEFTVTFNGGRTYTIIGVDAATYADFVVAPSPGGFFTRNIKDRYPYRKG